MEPPEPDDEESIDRLLREMGLDLPDDETEADDASLPRWDEWDLDRWG
jgi:hypothetical protein